MNKGTISREQLTTVDKTVYSPAESELLGRSLFASLKVNDWDQSYEYDSITYTGKAVKSSDRATNLPVVEESKLRDSVNITQIGAAIEYSYEDLGRSQQVGDDLLTRRATEVKRVINEREDRIIFNGEPDSNPKFNIYGLTSDAKKTGFQSASPTKTLDQLDNNAIRKFFKDTVHQITNLPGNSGAKPLLLIPDSVATILDEPYNEYSGQTTVKDMLSKYFADIRTVWELEGKYNGTGKDMGVMCLNDNVSATIIDAMYLQRKPLEYTNGVYRIPYFERMGGLAIRRPANFVQLTGIMK